MTQHHQSGDVGYFAHCGVLNSWLPVHNRIRYYFHFHILQTQIQELKQAQNTSAAQLRTMLLDPAVNIMFQQMKKEMDASKEKLEQAQNDLAAWKFTPDR